MENNVSYKFEDMVHSEVIEESQSFFQGHAQEVNSIAEAQASCRALYQNQSTASASQCSTCLILISLIVVKLPITPHSPLSISIIFTLINFSQLPGSSVTKVVCLPHKFPKYDSVPDRRMQFFFCTVTRHK